MDTKKVIALLDEAYQAEVTAIHQYMSHHYSLDSMGYVVAAQFERSLSIAEMRHAEKIGERILYFGGIPSETPRPEVRRGGDVLKMLSDDRELERTAIEMYQRNIRGLRDLGDHGSAMMLESILSDEEEHFDRLRNETDKIESLGAAYLAELGRPKD